MATAEGLMGLGTPAEVALRQGWSIVEIATDTAGQGAGQISGKGNKIVRATPDAGDDAVTLPAEADLGDEIVVYNEDDTNSLDVFPASGHSINGVAADDGVAVAAETSLHLIKKTATSWLGLTTGSALSAT